jgi:hypothetical protein
MIPCASKSQTTQLVRAYPTRFLFIDAIRVNFRLADDTIACVRYENSRSRSSTIALTSSLNSTITALGSASCVRLSHKAIRSITRANRRQPDGNRPPRPVRNVRLDFRVRESLIAQKVADIDERRACNCELPVEHSSHTPIPTIPSYQQIPRAKVAVHQKLIGAEQLRVKHGSANTT